MRSNLSYYDRQLPKTFENVEFKLAGADDLGAAMDALFELHQQRWNARLLPGVMGGERIRGFHQTIARRFQENDWLRLHLIVIDGKIVSSLYCFEFREKYYYYLGGFAPELGRYSLGTVLTARAVKHAIERGCKEFDFLRGNEPYKYRWQPEERVNHRVLIADSASARSRVMLGINRLERYVEHRAKEFAEHRGRSKK
jgi:CelD/BcsL family acetyltransferase involved in cellulose biosynthesis